jgi:hypothetical protein
MWFLGKWSCVCHLDMRQANGKFAASSGRMDAAGGLVFDGRQWPNQDTKIVASRAI